MNILEKSRAEKVNIRKATIEDMTFIMFCAEKEGWNPGIEDGKVFYETDPNGFYIAEVDEKRVGCVSGVAYDDRYGFLGLYIVIPEYRNRGIGKKLFAKALEYLGKRTIGLDGVVDMQESYKAYGFRPLYRNARFKCEGGGTLPKTLCSIDKVPFETLNEFDRKVFGMDRTKFIRNWIAMPNAKGLAFCGKDEGLHGYGVIRKCKAGYKIGPLFAQEPAIAIDLFEGLKSLAPGNEIFLDVPNTNLNALNLAKSYGMEKVFETIRMYNRILLSPNLGYTYGVTSFELG